MKMDTELNDRAICVNESLSILPLMTALFVEGFGSAGPAVGSSIKCRYATIEKRSARIFRLPLIPGTSEPEAFFTRLSHRMLKEEIGKQDRETVISAHRTSVIHSLVSGISQNYNNILMSVLGNATLIRLQLTEAEPGYEHAARMEGLIQSGSFLIHMVLGYLGESRIEAKRMCLHQLFKEMKAEVPGSLNESDFWKLEEKLQWASRTQNPRLIASNSARVLEVLFQEIQFLCSKLASCDASHHGVQTKLGAIQVLVTRGLALTQMLRLYAGDFDPHMTRVQLAPLVKRRLLRLREQHPNLKLDLKINRQLPVVLSDRQLIDCAVQQILQNATQAQLSDKHIAIALRRFQQEAPEDRCGVHMASDYVVITIQDAGPGLDPETQKRIFEPFFKLPDKQGHAGIGLAAAAAIIKAHGGYIQLQSTPGVGSTFKIYLPVAAAVVKQHNPQAHRQDTLKGMAVI